MPTNDELYTKNMTLLRSTGANYREFDHEPVYDYSTANKVKVSLGINGVESKNLFLKTKNGDYCMLVTLEGKRADLKMLKEILGAKVSIATDEELTRETGCEPLCAVPFGHDEKIILIIDQEIFQHPYLIYSPGPPSKTVEVATQDVHRLLKDVKNRVMYI